MRSTNLITYLLTMLHLRTAVLVGPSVKRVNCDKMKETYAYNKQQETSMHLVLWHEERLVVDVPFYLKF